MPDGESPLTKAYPKVNKYAAREDAAGSLLAETARNWPLCLVSLVVPSSSETWEGNMPYVRNGDIRIHYQVEGQASH
jgi:hypothetical protein